MIEIEVFDGGLALDIANVTTPIKAINTPSKFNLLNRTCQDIDRYEIDIDYYK